MEIVGHAGVDASEDEFAACDRCHHFIEAHDLQALVRHAARSQRRLLPEGTRPGKDQVVARSTSGTLRVG